MSPLLSHKAVRGDGGKGAGNKRAIALPSDHLGTWWDCGTSTARGPALMACRLAPQPDLLALSYRHVLHQPRVAPAPLEGHQLAGAM